MLKEALSAHCNVTVADINQAEVAENSVVKPSSSDACLKNCPGCECKEDKPSNVEARPVDNIEDIITDNQNVINFPVDTSDSKVRLHFCFISFYIFPMLLKSYF